MDFMNLKSNDWIYAVYADGTEIRSLIKRDGANLHLPSIVYFKPSKFVSITSGSKIKKV